MEPDTTDRTEDRTGREGFEDSADYSDGTDGAGRVWRPSSVDVLEAALSLAAIDARLRVGKEWSGFCLAAARRLNVPGAVPLRSGRRGGDDAARM
ncbi:MAG: hypothetical protein RBU21_09185 [FCB group bacterium]|jgi:hypothetical protein|nr:hypothetical protein [FCB group bacterium]